MKLKGGLGNQLFQYACGRALTLDSGKKLVLDISRFDSHRRNETPWPYALSDFHIKAQVGLSPFQGRLLKASGKKRGLKKKIAQLLFPVTHVTEAGFVYQEAARATALTGAYFFDGYWQSAKYFDHQRTALLDDLQLTQPLSARSQALLDKISLSSSSVALHIRRGDYVTNASANAVHGTCTIDYYLNAMSHMENTFVAPVFFVFSDDIEWAKSNLGNKHSMVFANYDQNVPAHEDMHLISACQHQVIANSSFSWWGAWLNRNPDKIVIAPQKWFQDAKLDTRDLVPDAWVKISG